MRAVQRQVYGEGRAFSGSRDHFDMTPMRPSNAAHCRKAEASAAWSGGEEGIEDAGEILFIDARAVV